MKRALTAVALLVVLSVVGISQKVRPSKPKGLDALKASIQALRECPAFIAEPASYPSRVRHAVKASSYKWQVLETSLEEIEQLARMCSGVQAWRYRDLMRKETAPDAKRIYANLMYRATMDAKWPIEILALTERERRFVEDLFGIAIAKKPKPKRKR